MQVTAFINSEQPNLLCTISIFLPLPALIKGNSDCFQLLTLVSPAVFHYPANRSVSFKTNLAYSDVADRL